MFAKLPANFANDCEDRMFDRNLSKLVRKIKLTKSSNHEE